MLPEMKLRLPNGLQLTCPSANNYIRPTFFRLFAISFGTRVFMIRWRQGSGCESRAAAQL